MENQRMKLDCDLTPAEWRLLHFYIEPHEKHCGDVAGGPVQPCRVFSKFCGAIREQFPSEESND